MKSSLGSGPLVWMGIILTTCLLLFLFQKILWLVIPLLLAVILTYLLQPLICFLIVRGCTQRQAIHLVMITLTLLVGLGFFFCTPWLAEKSMSWHESSKRYLAGGIGLISSTLTTLEKQIPFLQGTNLSDELTNKVAHFSADFAREYLLPFLPELVTWTLSLLLVPYIAYFFLLDGRKFKQFLLRAVPNAFFEKTLLLCHRVDEQVQRYFKGLMLLTLLDAAVLAVGLAFLGISSPILLGLVTGVLAWLPYIGSALGCLLVMMVAAADYPGNGWMAYSAIGLFIGVRLLDDFFFINWTIGKSLQVHPLVTVLMIFIGGEVAGISGLLLVMPVMGVVMVFGEILGQVLTDERLKARHAHAKRLRQKSANADFHL